MKVKNILWDFDGVILDSMRVRDWGFEEIFKKFPAEQVAKLLEYHRENGGLSRYVKIRYFYEKILHENISDDRVNEYANEFSKIMRSELINPKNLINDVVEFIKSNHKNNKFHIVSGSDQEELRFLCEKLRLSDYFVSINGSPTPKKILVEEVLNKYKYDNLSTCLIGDSINDYEAAKQNKIFFFGYNNVRLEKNCEYYIKSFSNFSELYV